MTKKGGGSGERNFNRKKVNVKQVVSKIKKNKKMQKGVFNVNLDHKNALSAKKARRVERKHARKVEKRQKKADEKEEAEHGMNIESIDN